MSENVVCADTEDVPATADKPTGVAIGDGESKGAVGLGEPPPRKNPKRIKFSLATAEQIAEWKAGRLQLWRYDVMGADGEWKTEGWCTRTEVY